MTQPPEDISQADELNELERLLAEATPGPWARADWAMDYGSNLWTIEGSEPEILSPGSSSIWPGGICKLRVAEVEDSGKPDENAELIVAAVNALPKLIATVRLAHTPARGVPREATAEMRAALEMQERAEIANANCPYCEGEGNWAECEPCSILFGDAIDARRATLDAAPQSEGVGGEDLRAVAIEMIAADEARQGFVQYANWLRAGCPPSHDFELADEEDRIRLIIAALSRPDPVGQRDDIRAATIEECARVADETANDVLGEYTDRADGYRDGCKETAKAIRALAASTGDVGGGE